MKLGPSSSSLFVAVAIAASACGGAQSSGEARCPDAAPGGTESAAVNSPPPPLTGDPAVLTLAEASRACNGGATITSTCAGDKAWRDEKALFENNKAAPTLISMLEQPDTKLRVLAIDKLSIFYPCEAVKDKALAARFVASARREDYPAVAGWLGRCVAKLPAAQIGAGDALLALAKHPQRELRSSLARVGAAAPASQSPAALKALRVLLQDNDIVVQQHALATLGAWQPSDEVCGLVRAQLSRTDHLRGTAQMAAAESACPGLRAESVASMGKHLVGSSLVVNEFGATFAQAVGTVCMAEDVAPDLKPKAFEIAKTLTDVKLSDPETRIIAAVQLAICDRDLAKPILTDLAKDADEDMRTEAKRQLDDL